MLVQIILKFMYSDTLEYDTVQYKVHLIKYNVASQYWT